MSHESCVIYMISGSKGLNLHELVKQNATLSDDV